MRILVSRRRYGLNKFWGNPKRSWKFNLSPLFLQYLQGKIEYECTPWGMPTYNVFGWQKPCYLLQDGYAATFAELMESTAWEKYGTKSGNPKCQDCMVHSATKLPQWVTLSAHWPPGLAAR